MDIELTADLNAQDEPLGWAALADAHDADCVRPGAMLLAGNRYGQAVVMVSVDDDGQVDFAILPGSVEKNRHVLAMPVA